MNNEQNDTPQARTARAASQGFTNTARHVIDPAQADDVRRALSATEVRQALSVGSTDPPVPTQDPLNTTGQVETVKNVDHPAHYNRHPSGVECIEVVEHMNFNVGNAIKYLWRADHKGGLEDLRKAVWYAEREIERRSREG